MDFDTAEFLEGLFDATVVSEAGAVEPAPEGDAVTDEAPGASRFAGWVRRQDVAGRWGWEAPDLPEVDRWWARWRFEELPQLPSAP